MVKGRNRVASMNTPSSAVSRYLQQVQRALATVVEENGGAGSPVYRAAQLVADCVSHGGLVHVFGSGHSHLLAEEVFFRAGGLLDIDPVLESALMLHEGALKSTRMERLPGYAAIIADDREIRPGDVLIVISNSGRNAVPVELAEIAKGRGVPVIAITSMEHSRRVRSRAPSGRRLFETADVVIDNHAPYGDACVDIEGVSYPVGALSTITGAAILNAVMVGAVEILARAGRPPVVLPSANRDDGGEETGWGAFAAPSRRGLRHL